MKFNERLIRRRKEKGLSQEQLAEMLEVSRQAVSKWELSETKPDMDKLLLLGEKLDISLDELCGIPQKESIPVIKEEGPLSNIKKKRWISAMILTAVLLIGIVSGYLIHEIPDRLQRDIEIISLSVAVKSEDSMTHTRTLCLAIVLNERKEDTAITLLKVDSEGKKTTYTANCVNGVYICYITQNQYESFTVAAILVHQKKESMISLLNVAGDGSYKETWNN